MDKDYQDYKNFEMSGAVRGIPPQVARIQAKNRQAKATQDDLIGFFDSDVQQFIKQHNTLKDRMRVNQMIRLLFAGV